MHKPDLPDHYRDLYVVHMMLRQLGYESADMFVGFERVVGIGENVLFVQLRTQGKEFNCSVAQLAPGVDRDEVLGGWSVSCRIANGASDGARARWRRESVWGAEQALRRLVGTLAARGFEIPALNALKAQHGDAAMEMAAKLWGEPIAGLNLGGDA